MVPVRCERCGTIINIKTSAKVPKYCPKCRDNVQREFKSKLSKFKQERVKDSSVFFKE